MVIGHAFSRQVELGKLTTKTAKDKSPVFPLCSLWFNPSGDAHAAVDRHGGAGLDEASHDDVLLKSAQEVYAALAC